MKPCSSKESVGGRGVNGSEWTISLPVAIRHNDARLQAAARNLLKLPEVRSVTISGERELATVRLRAHRSPKRDVGAIPASIFTEQPPADEVMHLDGDSVVSWVDARNQSWNFIALPPGERGAKRWMLLAAAGLALVLGLLGVVLPGLPTTPFVLVSSFCLLRSSPRLHERLLSSKLFGGVLRDWHVHRGLRPHVRYKATAVIVFVLGASLLLTTMPLAAKLLILAVAAIGITYVWRLPTVAD
ncbi:MAG: YbaN family protein [Pirellulales bacterium]